jgi:hypothetical protein
LDKFCLFPPSWMRDYYKSLCKNRPKLSESQKCELGPNEETCVHQLIWTWPVEYTQDYYYLLTVHLSLFFALVSIAIVHYMLFGLICPC